MGYGLLGVYRFMGYGVQIPVHRLGGPKKLWDIRGYAFMGYLRHGLWGS